MAEPVRGSRISTFYAGLRQRVPSLKLRETAIHAAIPHHVLNELFAPLVAARLSHMLNIPAHATLEALGVPSNPPPPTPSAEIKAAFFSIIQIHESSMAEHVQLVRQMKLQATRIALTQELSRAGVDIPKIMKVAGDCAKIADLEDTSVYLFEKATGKLQLVYRDRMLGESRFKEATIIPPGEKRYFITSDKQSMVIDRKKPPEEAPPEDCAGITGDLERDLASYASRKSQETAKEALAENLYWRISTDNEYDIIVQANGHSSNMAGIDAKKPIRRIFEDEQKQRDFDEILSELAPLVANALQRAEGVRARENAERRLALLTTLQEKISLTTDLSELYKEVLGSLDEQFRVSKGGHAPIDSPIGKGSIMLYSSESRRLEEISSRSTSKRRAKQSPIAQSVFDSGESILAIDARQTIETIEHRVLSGIDQGSFMCVPIISEDLKTKRPVIYGVLTLRSKILNAFDRTDLKHFETIGRVLGNAINRVRSNLELQTLYETQQQLADARTYDEVTGLLTRKVGLERAEKLFALLLEDDLSGRTPLPPTRSALNDEALRTAPIKEASVVFTDGDHFKSVNDTLGHRAGDCVLRGIATAAKRYLVQIQNALPGDKNYMPGCIIVSYKYGGEEFNHALFNVPPEKSEQIAEDLRNRVENLIFYYPDGSQILNPDGTPFKMTMTVGVAHFNTSPQRGKEGRFSIPPKPRTYEELVDRADMVVIYKKSCDERNTSSGWDPSIPRIKKS